MIDLTRHPCFNAKACEHYGRIHLPVAPACNVQCNFCNRKFSCVNESRPGVTAKVLSPENALQHLQEVVSKRKDISVVGIAGPGDPFANVDETLTTMRFVRDSFPDMLLCVSTNGLGLEPNIDKLKDLNVSHVTVTINGINPAIVEKIYSWISIDGKFLSGREAAEIIIDRQSQAVKFLHAAGILVKINSIIIPGVNDEHLPIVAKTVAKLGADIHNCIPLLPTKNTLFASLPEPDLQLIHSIRSQTGEYLMQMNHCNRCRADACGLLNTGLNSYAQPSVTERAVA